MSSNFFLEIINYTFLHHSTILCLQRTVTRLISKTKESFENVQICIHHLFFEFSKETFLPIMLDPDLYIYVNLLSPYDIIINFINLFHIWGRIINISNLNQLWLKIYLKIHEKYK